MRYSKSLVGIWSEGVTSESNVYRGGLESGGNNSAKSTIALESVERAAKAVYVGEGASVVEFRVDNSEVRKGEPTLLGFSSDWTGKMQEYRGGESGLVSSSISSYRTAGVDDVPEARDGMGGVGRGTSLRLTVMRAPEVGANEIQPLQARP